MIGDLRSENFQSKRLHLYGALLYCALIPFHQKWVTWALLLWVAVSLIQFSKADFDKNVNLIWLPLLYLTYFIGFFTLGELSFRFLETKLSLVVFPLLFFLHKYTSEDYKKLMKVFVFGLAVSGMVCLLVACYNSVGIFEGHLQFKANVLPGKGFMESIMYGGNYFFGSYLSIFHQTVYYALYLCIGITLLLYNPKLFKVRYRIGLILFFLVLIFLISNKASLVALACIFCIKVLSAAVSIKKRLFRLSFIAITMIFFLTVNPRARESLLRVVNGELVINKNARYGFGTRLLSWDAALTLIEKNPILGYGAADAQNKLNEVYEEQEYKFPLKEEYNAHNLWLQTWIENGIPGIIILGILFYFLFRACFKNGGFEPFIFSMVVVLLLNTLFESMFHRFSGISFVAFLTCYIVTTSKRKEASL